MVDEYTVELFDGGRRKFGGCYRIDVGGSNGRSTGQAPQTLSGLPPWASDYLTPGPLPGSIIQGYYMRSVPPRASSQVTYSSLHTALNNIPAS